MNMKSAKLKRVRAVAGSANQVGMTRFQLYRNAWGRVADAESKGFYLEAITLIESLLSDRLESRARHLTGTDHGFRNLGPLLNSLRKADSDAAFLQAYGLIDVWRAKRNEALHELVKFEEDHRVTWEDKVRPLPQIVTQGRAVFRKYDRLVKQDRK